LLPGESYEQNSFRPDRRRSACGPKNDVRFYLNGVLIESHADGAIIVATDGHRMLVVRTSLPWDIGKIIVPRNACELVAKMKGDVYFSAVGDASRFKAERGGQAIEFAAVDGTYPDWRAAVSKPNELKLSGFAPAVLEGVVKAAGVICGDRRQGHFTDSGDWRRRGGHVRYWRHHRSEHQVRV
jgi:DNA polymerase-3 subunit beta